MRIRLYPLGHLVRMRDRGRGPFRFLVPKPIGMIWYDGILISIRAFVTGLPVEYRASRSPVGKPWEIVGKVAAEIHQLPIRSLAERLDLGGYSTRQNQALSAASQFKKYTVPEIQDALHWISENLPSKQQSVLIHGDLLGQNIFRTLEGALFVMDWEYSRMGDPAYDLAIVTRGAKKPFQASGGLDRLIAAYLGSGGQELSRRDVHVYELLLCLGWYEQSLDRSQGGHGPKQYLNKLRGLLKRLESP